MPRYFIRTTNATLRGSDHGADYADVAEARQTGVQGAIDIAKGEAAGGAEAVSVEIAIADRDGEVVRRSIVTLTVADILPPG